MVFITTIIIDKWKIKKIITNILLSILAFTILITSLNNESIIANINIINILLIQLLFFNFFLSLGPTLFVQMISRMNIIIRENIMINNIGLLLLLLRLEQTLSRLQICITIFNSPYEILILLLLFQLTILNIKLNNLINNQLELLNLMNM